MKLQLLLVENSPIWCAQLAAGLVPACGGELAGMCVSLEQAVQHLSSSARSPDFVLIALHMAHGARIEQLVQLARTRGAQILYFDKESCHNSVVPPHAGSSSSHPDLSAGPETSRTDRLKAIGAERLISEILRKISPGLQTDRADPPVKATRSVAGQEPGQNYGCGPQTGKGASERSGHRAPTLVADANAAKSSPVVCIGASTGGLPVLQQILQHFPDDGPPTVIVQHIRGEFSAGLAARLDRACKIEVLEAYDGAVLRPGRAYLAPGDMTHLELRGRGGRVCRLTTQGRISGHRPSVDALFHSAARYAAPNLIGVLLTGMGRDGAEGLFEIRKNGGLTIVQDSATSTVYGMPRAAVELGAAIKILPDHAIGAAILSGFCGAGATQDEVRP